MKTVYQKDSSGSGFKNSYNSNKNHNTDKDKRRK